MKKLIYLDGDKIYEIEVPDRILKRGEYVSIETDRYMPESAPAQIDDRYGTVRATINRIEGGPGVKAKIIMSVRFD